MASRVVVAPDSFKGSIGAVAAARAMAAAVRTAYPDAEVREAPVADGGEGTVDVLVSAGWARRTVATTGPHGRPVQADYALSPVTTAPPTAVVELAQAAGLSLVEETDALSATTYGVGAVVRAALDEGVTRVVLAVGGSATTDAGAGLARALGARLLDEHGDELPDGGSALARLDRIDVTGLDRRLTGVELQVACDVDNPLTGPRGAAHVYAPQKGATPADVEVLEAGLTRFGAVVHRDLGIDVMKLPGAGAAGGVGAGAVALLGARLVTGIDLLLDLVGFDRILAGADLVVTGEGSFDAQSLHGKAPIGVARRARRLGVPTVVVAGRVDLTAVDPELLTAAGIVATYALLDLEPDPRAAAEQAPTLLARAGATAVRDHVRQRT